MENNNQKSVVDWFAEELINLGFIDFPNDPLFVERLEKAKQMEEKLKKDLYDYGFVDGCAIMAGDEPTSIYNELYHNLNNVEISANKL